MAQPLHLAAVCVAVLIAASPTGPPDRAAQWKKVDEAVNKGLPKTAIQELEPIIASALKDKAYPEAIQAISKKIALEGNIQGNKPEERITRMKAEIAKAPKEMVPVMDAILANWYWHYFQQNRWRFMQRTATATAPSDDFTTWDLKRIFAEIDKQFTKALSADKELKATPIATYDALLEKGTMPDSYRPTLFDFVAFDALQFYTSAEQAGARPEDAFESAADSPALGSADEFLKWTPQTTDTDSPKVKAIKLYQNVMEFHQEDQDKSAFLDADLSRLQFANANAFGDDKATRYKAALKQFAASHARTRTLRDGPLPLGGGSEQRERQGGSTQDRARRPERISEQQRRQAVLTIWCSKSKPRRSRSRPNASGTIRCRILRVSYRNIDKVHFRAVKFNWTSRLTRDRWRPEYLTEADRNDLVTRQAGSRMVGRLCRQRPTTSNERKTCRRRRGSSPASISSLPALPPTSATPTTSSRRPMFGSAISPSSCARNGARAKSKASCSTPSPASRSPTRRSRRGSGRTLAASRRPGDQDRSERPVQVARRQSQLLHSCQQGRPGTGDHERVRELHLSRSAIGRLHAHRSLHRSLALSPRADGSLQGHLHLGRHSGPTTTR